MRTIRTVTHPQLGETDDREAGGGEGAEDSATSPSPDSPTLITQGLTDDLGEDWALVGFDLGIQNADSTSMWSSHLQNLRGRRVR